MVYMLFHGANSSAGPHPCCLQPWNVHGRRGDSGFYTNDPEIYVSHNGLAYLIGQRHSGMCFAPKAFLLPAIR